MKDKHSWLRRVDGKFYLVAPKRRVYECNEIAARIFDLCDGNRTVDHMVDKLMDVFEVDRSRLKGDVEVCLNRLEELTYLTSGQ